MRPRHLVYAVVPALLYVGKMLIFTPFRMRRMVIFHRSLGRSAGQRLSGGAIANRGWFGRHEWAGICAGQTENDVSAICAFGFYFCGHR